MKQPIVAHDASLPLVHLCIATNTGSFHDPKGKEGLTRILARLMRRTASGLNSQAVDARFDAMGSSLGADIGYSSAGFAGSVISRSLSEYLKLVAGVVQSPGLDEKEFDRLKRETIAEIIELRDNDQVLVRSWFRRTLFAGHPYGRTALGTPASIESLTLEDVKRHYAETLQAGALTFAFAGDIDEAQAQAAADQLRATLPLGTPQSPELEAPRVIKGRHLLVVDKPSRTQTQILIGGLGSRPSDDDHTALVVANTVFGGTFTSRLTQEVRAERGWSYGAYSSLPYGKQRQAFSMLTFPAAADAAKCAALQLQLLEEWIKNGITKQELERAQQYLIRSNVFSNDTAAKRMGLTLDEHLYDLPKGYYAEYADRVAHVSLEQANSAVARRISADNLLFVVVGTASEIHSSLEAALPNLATSKRVAFDTVD